VKSQHRNELEAMFAFICQHQRRTGSAPSLREMGEAFFMAPGTILRYLDKMEAQGWITREWGKARSMKLRRTCATPDDVDESE
jgi:DNA-binding PadR family transcriptional regulator